MDASLFEQFLSLNAQSLPLIVLIVAFAGFVSGLTGFGFSAVGVALLWVMGPARAIPLLMALSVANQLLSIHQLRQDMVPLSQWWSRGPAAYIVGGLCGAPVGVWVMANLPAVGLAFATGLVLLAYAVFMVFRPQAAVVARGGAGAHLGVGLLGGVIGGFTAFPGCAMVVWAGLRNFSKKEQRSVVQPYILAMQIASLASMTVLRSGELSSNPFDGAFWFLFGLLMPVVLPMTHLGVIAFRKLSDLNFKNVTMGVIALSGGGLVYKSLATLGIGAVVLSSLR